MRVELSVPVAESRMCVQHGQVLVMVLQPGSIEAGLRRSEMTRSTYGAGDMFLCHRYLGKWIRTDDLHYLSVAISNTALTAARDGTSGEVELPSAANLVDARLGALVAAVNAERIAGFPSGRLFLDSVEQALAVALVGSHAVRGRSERTYRGGLGPSRLRRIRELVHAKMEDELTLHEMAQSVGLSTAHFSQMFRKSTGERPHEFVLRHRIERAKEMLRAAEVRILDVAVACGFKTQQHFARVFRQMCGASPTEYREQFLYQGATCAWETSSHDRPSLAVTVSAGKFDDSPAARVIRG
jgi:AraC family transcriptional regulator